MYEEMKKWRYSVRGLLGSTYSGPTFHRGAWTAPHQPAVQAPAYTLLKRPPDNQGKTWMDEPTPTRTRSSGGPGAGW